MGGSRPDLDDLTPVRLSLQTSLLWSALSGVLAPDWPDLPGSHSPVPGVDGQSESAGDSQPMRHICYLAVADDEEGVSSRSLSDDIISIFIMSLKTQDSIWLEDSKSYVTTEEDYT